MLFWIARWFFNYFFTSDNWILKLSWKHLKFLLVWKPCFWLARTTRGGLAAENSLARTHMREHERGLSALALRDGGLDSSPPTTDHVLAMLRALRSLWTTVNLYRNPTPSAELSDVVLSWNICVITSILGDWLNRMKNCKDHTSCVSFLVAPTAVVIVKRG